MKKLLWVLWILSMSVASANQTACDTESMNSHPQFKQLKKLCLPVAKQLEKTGEYSVASWYYLLSGKNKYNREVIAPQITFEDGNFANVAHSFVLAGDIQTAQKLYGYFLYVAEPTQANVGAKADYALLYKLYPKKKRYLQLGEQAWRDIYHKIRKNSSVIELNNAKLVALQTAHDNKAMIALFKKQLRLYQESFGTEHPDVATLYANIGIAYNDLGDYTKALTYKRKGLTLRQKILSPNDPRLADSYNDVGVSYQIIGNDKKALEFLTKSLQIREKNPHTKAEILSQLYSTIARSFSQRKLPEKAAYYQQKSIELSTKSGDTFTQAYAYNNQGNAYFSKGEYTKAIKAFEKSLALRQKQKPIDTLALVQSYANLSLAYRQSGKYKKALSFAKKALKHSQTLGAQIGLAGSYQDIGWIYFAMGDYNKAYDYAKKAFELFMHSREENFVLLDAADKEHYLKNTNGYIFLLVESAYLARKDLKMMVDTFNDWIRYKGSLFDSENMLSVAYRKTDDPILKTAIKSLSDKKRSLAKLYQTKASDSEKQRKHIKEIESQIQQLRTKLSTQIRGFEILKKLKQVSDVEVVSGLAKDELYIDFARIAENYFVFIVNAEGEFHMQFINVKLTEKINRAIRAFRQNITRHKPASQKRLSLLYNLLLQDILEDKRFRDKQRLILSLDGLLHLFPFEALYDKRVEKYLIESKDIRYIPNAREMIRLQSQAEQKPNPNMVLFANPNYNAPATGEYIELNASRKLRLKKNFLPLPGTKAEAEVIQKILSGGNIITYFKNQATEANLYNVHKPTILHIATHGFFIRNGAPNSMLNSAIALAGANYALTLGKDEGVVSALKLSGLDLEGTELVVLSACETGVMEADATDSISGLSKAFIQAGARDIIVSLWSVSDMGTKELMRRFYQFIKQYRGHYSQALRQAKIQMIRKKVPLSIWAPFILNGM